MTSGGMLKLPRVPVVGDVVVYTKGPAVGSIHGYERHAALVVRAEISDSLAVLRGHVPDAYTVSLKVFDHYGESYFVRTAPFTTSDPGTPEADGRWAWRPTGEWSVSL